MKGHNAIAVERGTSGDQGQYKGYAARCDTCGAVTFGGFRTKTDAKAALEHSTQGMGAAAITPIVGADRKTVMKDVRQVVQSGPPAPVQGMDGKTYIRPESQH